MSELFFSMRPAYPWSVYPIGIPALIVVALLLALFTVWTYLRHPQATRKRVIIIMGLRLLALAVALITAIRPSIGFQEEPKIPSTLLVGVDVSESMTVKDEVNSQARIDAVRRVLDKCQPTLDELANDQNVNIKFYGFSTPDFDPDANVYDPKAPADGKRSDYGTFLNKTFEKWQGERFLRGVILIGDGIDNGTAFAALGEASRFGKRSVPIATFTAGQSGTDPNARDLQIVSVRCDPSPVPIKNDLTVVARINAYGYQDTRIKARVYFDDKPIWTEDAFLTKQKDNEVRIAIPGKAPEKPGEVKVRVEIGREEGDKIVPLPGEVAAANNQSETYLTVTKEGVRVLIIDRLRFEETFLREALQKEKRFDVVEVIRQTTLPGRADEQQLLNLDEQAYDVVIIGNVSYEQLRTALPDGSLPDKLLDRVANKGMGIMFLGGEAAFTGYPAPPGGNPETRPLAFADLLPVVPSAAGIFEKVNAATKVPETFQTVPTARGFDDRVASIDRDDGKARQLWNDLNGVHDGRKFRITGYNQFKRKPTATTYAFAATGQTAVKAGNLPPAGADDLIVGGQIGVGNKGRILAFGAYDTYLWEGLGQPQEKKGVEIHDRFWKQCVLWLAHQEEEEGQVYARPEFRRLPIGGDQTIWVGLKSPAGGDEPNPDLEVKILPPGQDKPEDEAKAPRQTVLKTTKDGKPANKVLFKPPLQGEYTVVVTAPMKGPDGRPMNGPDGKPMRYRSAVRFIAFPEVSDEMLLISAAPSFMEKISAASGGKALRLEDLPDFLRELKSQNLENMKPKPRYTPDWRRNHSKGFLPAWLILFVTFLGLEWGLRRLWGMV